MKTQVLNVQGAIGDIKALPALVKRGDKVGRLAAGGVLTKRAKTRAPSRTGRLRAKGIGVSVSAGSNQDEVNVGTNRIGRFMELGTRRMAAKPFLRPSISAGTGEMESAYVKAASNVIERGTK